MDTIEALESRTLFAAPTPAANHSWVAGGEAIYPAIWDVMRRIDNEKVLSAEPINPGGNGSNGNRTVTIDVQLKHAGIFDNGEYRVYVEYDIAANNINAQFETDDIAIGGTDDSFSSQGGAGWQNHTFERVFEHVSAGDVVASNITGSDFEAGDVWHAVATRVQIEVPSDYGDKNFAVSGSPTGAYNRGFNFHYNSSSEIWDLNTSEFDDPTQWDGHMEMTSENECFGSIDHGADAMYFSAIRNSTTHEWTVTSIGGSGWGNITVTI